MTSLLLRDYLRRHWWICPMMGVWVWAIASNLGDPSGKDFSIMAFFVAIMFVNPLDLEIRLNKNGRALMSLPTSFGQRCRHYWMLGIALPILITFLGIEVACLQHVWTSGETIALNNLLRFFLATSVCCAGWYLLTLSNKNLESGITFLDIALIVLVLILLLLRGGVPYSTAIEAGLAVSVVAGSWFLTPQLLDRRGWLLRTGVKRSLKKETEKGATEADLSFSDRLLMNPLIAIPTIGLGILFLMAVGSLLPSWIPHRQSGKIFSEGLFEFYFPMCFTIFFMLVSRWASAARVLAALPFSRLRLFSWFLISLAIGILPIVLWGAVVDTWSGRQGEFPFLAVWVGTFASMLVGFVVNLRLHPTVGIFLCFLGSMAATSGPTHTALQLLLWLLSLVSITALWHIFFRTSEPFKNKIVPSWSADR